MVRRFITFSLDSIHTYFKDLTYQNKFRPNFVKLEMLDVNLTFEFYFGSFEMLFREEKLKGTTNGALLLNISLKVALALWKIGQSLIFLSV